MYRWYFPLTLSVHFVKFFLFLYAAYTCIPTVYIIIPFIMGQTEKNLCEVTGRIWRDINKISSENIYHD